MKALRAICVSGATLLILASLAFPVPALAARIDAAAALEQSEAAIGATTGDHRLIRSDGSALLLSELRGRPLVVSLIYTSCSSVCPVTTQTLRSAVAEARAALGEASFEVLTLGFDTRNDTPRRMAAFATDHAIAGDPLWHVATASPATLQTLLEEVGFSYSGAAGGFEHITQTTILDADGRVYRQVYGDEFPLQVFIEPLKQLVYGVRMTSLTPSALADRVRFICTVFDPKLGRYRLDYTIFAEASVGILSFLLMGWIIVRLWRGSRRSV